MFDDEDDQYDTTPKDHDQNERVRAVAAARSRKIPQVQRRPFRPPPVGDMVFGPGKPIQDKITLGPLPKPPALIPDPPSAPILPQEPLEAPRPAQEMPSDATGVAARVDTIIKRVSAGRWDSPKSWSYDGRNVMVQYTWWYASCLSLAAAKKYLEHLENGGDLEHFKLERRDCVDQ